jgi:ComEC/Rec2-related protein
MTLPPRRPLIGLALAFITGTGLGLCGLLPAPSCLAMSGALILAAALLTWSPSLRRSRRAGRAATLALGVAVLGLGAANARLSQVTPHAPELAAEGTPDPVELRGIVMDTPMPPSARPGAYRFPIEVTAARFVTNGPWQTVSGTVRLRWFGPAGRLPAYGEEWQWRGHRDGFRSRTGSPGPASGRTPVPLFTTTSRLGERLSVGHGNPFVAWCLRLRSACLALITEGIGDFPEQVGILTSLVLGYRSQIPAELYQAFAATGTLHVFAVSGSHVVIIAGAIVFVLSAGGLPRTRWVLLLAPALTVYTIMTGLQASAVRACIMGIAYAAAPLFNRRADLYTSLAVAALLILAVNPADLTNAGFILSFVAVIGLGLFYPVFAAPLRRRLTLDPLQLQPEPRWKALSRAGLQHLVGLIAMSLAAWIATTPLTAWYFGLLSPIALPGNLAAVPLASLIIITGLLALVAGNVTLWLAGLFNYANMVFATLLAGSIRLLDAVPFGHTQVPPPTVLAVLAWYALLLLWRFKVWVDAPQQADPQPDGQ